MKEDTMDWMISQIFLSDTGVHEVYIHSKSMALRCDCPGYEARRSCKHTRFVKTRMDNHGGIYPTEISNKISKEASLMASEDPEMFRELLINYGKIETV
jgi:hypothetical protein